MLHFDIEYLDRNRKVIKILIKQKGEEEHTLELELIRLHGDQRITNSRRRTHDETTITHQLFWNSSFHVRIKIKSLYANFPDRKRETKRKMSQISIQTRRDRKREEKLVVWMRNVKREDGLNWRVICDGTNIKVLYDLLGPNFRSQSSNPHNYWITNTNRTQYFSTGTNQLIFLHTAKKYRERNGRGLF